MDNRVFSPHTRKAGGGPPCLWSYQGHLYKDRWRPANLEFLRATLTADAAGELLDRAAARLAPVSDAAAVADTVRAGFAERRDVVRDRCDELLRLLGDPDAHEQLDWWS